MRALPGEATHRCWNFLDKRGKSPITTTTISQIKSTAFSPSVIGKESRNRKTVGEVLLQMLGRPGFISAVSGPICCASLIGGLDVFPVPGLMMAG